MSKHDDFVIWNTVNVPIVHKCWHIHKIGKRLHRDFTKDLGEVPTARLMESGRIEDVVNPRGRAYGARNRLMYRNNKKKIAPAIDL